MRGCACWGRSKKVLRDDGDFEKAPERLKKIDELQKRDALSNTCEIDRLPKDIVKYIFDFLDPKSVSSFTSTCRKYHETIDDEWWKKVALGNLNINHCVVKPDWQKVMRIVPWMKWKNFALHFSNDTRNGCSHLYQQPKGNDDFNYKQLIVGDFGRSRNDWDFAVQSKNIMIFDGLIFYYGEFTFHRAKYSPNGKGTWLDAEKEMIGSSQSSELFGEFQVLYDNGIKFSGPINDGREGRVD